MRATEPMARLKYRGVTYELLFNLYAVEQIEDEFGGMTAMFEQLRGGKQYQTIRKLFRILGNAALEIRGLPEILTGDEIRHADQREIGEISKAIQAAFADGRKTETSGGNEADDERRDLYEDETDEKNG